MVKIWGNNGETQIQGNVKKSMGKGKKVLAFPKVLRHNSEARKRACLIEIACTISALYESSAIKTIGR